ncbi:hypothetical protein AGABI1DRAFT_120042 [Agaricus bisporus var. burnettii JB137-S8]|uniref:BTB domain-containing protein n=1 Tax=Agaricus bisporus var. burnettii (strain JB137-S8 / ATCC MYA-4627 / FGSC 10392) TaxID=597362 RepID=K5VZQ1_AGABU|nr:uncharacterized protein AGABI1DRAFT_120042 [Agaricus bisporus var. burnettii JB137-S8]EKM80004.1 hypothetical protein AGABI1DRAFT_120042 [Agaricus bisporus var. burnettii JB137-S8]
MSEHHRQLSSPYSPLPSRLPSVARPEWPWSTRSYARGGSQSSLHSQSSSVVGSSHLQTSWEPSRMSGFTNSTGTPPYRFPVVNSGAKITSSSIGQAITETPRQWTFTGLEWTVRDVQKLHDFIEGDGRSATTNQDQNEEFDILKQSHIMGDKFKLEIARTVHGEETLSPPRQTLSLYITPLMMDFAQADYEVPASMMAAVRYQDNRVGERGFRAGWVWQFWQHDWVFRQENEVWECPLPPLSELLQNSRIQETDSFVICVQVHCPAGPSIPEQPSVAYVPRDLLDGLEASLDNSNTGDVRFVCLEKHNPEIHPNALESPDPDLESQPRPSSSTSSQSTFPSTSTARKRVIYAHSDILTRRSEYFATMLSSAFSEGTEPNSGERKIYTIVVEEADFETMYWLLKFCYANWLLFKEQDDPRAAVEGVGAGWSARWLASRNGEWDWKTFHKAGTSDEGLTDTKSIASMDSVTAPAGGLSRSTSGASEVFQQSTINSNPITTNDSSVTKSHPTSFSRQPNRRPSSTLPVPINSSSTTRPKSDSAILSTTHYASTSQHHPLSPRNARPQQPSIISTPDPHPHPAPAPPPASALSMYQVAHRYNLSGLAILALEHMMTTISPRTSFALLLATATWEEPHVLVQDYVIDKWDEVSNSEDFEHCCQEIAAGEWGSNGAKTLTAVFRRLRSPATVG